MAKREAAKPVPNAVCVFYLLTRHHSADQKALNDRTSDEATKRPAAAYRLGTEGVHKEFFLDSLKAFCGVCASVPGQAQRRWPEAPSMGRMWNGRSEVEQIRPSEGEAARHSAAPLRFTMASHSFAHSPASLQGWPIDCNHNHLCDSEEDE